MSTRTLWLLALALGGCQTAKDWLGQEPNPVYCEAHPEKQFCKDVFPDAEPGCTTNDECAPPTAVCAPTTRTCVECTPAVSAACTGMTPVCSDDNACRACSVHGECASEACLPDGSCGVESAVAYVDPAGTDNTSCTKATPCTKLTNAVATGRAYMKITGTIDEGSISTIDNRNVTLLAAPGAKLARTSNGIVLEVKGTSRVKVYDLEISGGSGAQGIGISLPTGNTAFVELHRTKVTGNAGGGITATGGTVAISQSTISGNAGGGISISGAQFDITNNFIVGNGNPTITQSYGGVQLNNVNSGTRRFEFNTVTGNTAAMNATTGVVCVLVNQGITFSNNIVYDNQTSGTGTQVSNAGSNCNWTYSDIGPQTFASTGNINQAPQFANPTQGDYHIAPTSPCKDAGDPAATLAVDVDSDIRPQGAARDIGADEVP